MGVTELKTYSKDVFELEKQIYTYDQIIKKYDETIQEYKKDLGWIELGDRKIQFSRIQYIDVLDAPSEWKKDKEFRRALDESIKRGGIFGFISIAIGLIWIILSVSLVILLSKSNDDRVLVIILAIFFIVIPLTKIPIFILKKLDDLEKKKNDETFYDIYKRLWYEENHLIKERRLKKANFFEVEKRDKIIPQYIEAKKLLEKIYSKDILHRKYRNLVAIAQIYEYLDTGRCSELEGINGAYNLFESELRQNIIINKLDIIIDKLDQLISAMSNMVMAINNANDLLRSISSQIDAISENTTLIAFNTQCNAYNTEIANRYNIY